MPLHAAKKSRNIVGGDVCRGVFGSGFDLGDFGGVKDAFGYEELEQLFNGHLVKGGILLVFEVNLFERSDEFRGRFVHLALYRVCSAV